MLDIERFSAFLGASLLLSITPGPNLLYVSACSFGQGRKVGFISVLGIFVGGGVHVLAASLGLSAILISSPTVYNSLRYLGACYLIYLGVRSILKTSRRYQTLELAETDLEQVFKQAVLVNALNPSIPIFFVAFLPQFINPSSNQIVVQMIFLGALYNLISSTASLVVTLLSSSINLAGSLETSSYWRGFKSKATGSAFILLGIGFIVFL